VLVCSVFPWRESGVHSVFPSMAMLQFKGIQHIPRLSYLSTVTCEYRFVEIDIAVAGHASEFWEVCRSSIDFSLYSMDD